MEKTARHEPTEKSNRKSLWRAVGEVVVVLAASIFLLRFLLSLNLLLILLIMMLIVAVAVLRWRF